MRTVITFLSAWVGLFLLTWGLLEWTGGGS